MQTPDQRWRIEGVRRGDHDFFRLVHDDNVVDDLLIDDLQQLLARAGVDMADFVEADADTAHTPRDTAGAA